MQIRPVEKADIEELAVPLSKLGTATFTESFGHLYSSENLAFFFNKNHSETAYRNSINNPEQFIWVAQIDQELVGYLTLCPNGLPCDPPVPNAIELNRLYVRTTHHNQGIGQKLMDAAIAHIRSNEIDNIVLSVWSENFAGHRFYQRNGFEKIGEYLFPVGDHYDREWIMLKTL